MSMTTAPGTYALAARAVPRRSRQWLWLAGAIPFSFLVPFVLADQGDLPRDLFYGMYTLAVAAFVLAWARDSKLSRHDLFRQWRAGVVLGLLAAASLVLLVIFSEDATSRPSGLVLVVAVAWRGVVYGVTDAVLLTVFPVLAVFAAFRGHRTGLRRTILVGLVALLASLTITATYHLGYSDFRTEKVRKPLTGDLIWSAPTLLTLSPLGAPIAHAGLHVSAVLHSYETETFLPPHDEEP